MISVFGWPDPNTAVDQSDHALCTCYFISITRRSIERLVAGAIGIYILLK